MPEQYFVEELLNAAKESFLSHEKLLLANDSNERSLTHKFAEYLQVLINERLERGWSVDCEYNRFGDEPKIVKEIKYIVDENTSTDDTKAHTVYPDIIVHKRGPDGPNLIVIEAKKNATAKERDDDIQKLSRIKEQYGYTFAVFVNFLTTTQDIEISIIPD